jgi:cytochrome bd-type quinol oxidase subunit 1
MDRRGHVHRETVHESIIGGKDFFAVLFNPVAQSKFLRTVSAGYVAGAMFVMSVSACYLQWAPCGS